MKIVVFDIGGMVFKMGVVLLYGEIILIKFVEISGSDGD